MEELECKRHRRRRARASADFQGVCAACVEERLAKILQNRAGNPAAVHATTDSASSSSRPSEGEITSTETIASLIDREISIRRSSCSDAVAPPAPPPPGSLFLMKSRSTGWILNKLSLVTTPGSSPSRKAVSSSSSKNSHSSLFSGRSRSARPASSGSATVAVAGSSPLNPRYYRPSTTCSSAASLSLRKLRHCFLPTATSHDPLHI